MLQRAIPEYHLTRDFENKVFTISRATTDHTEVVAAFHDVDVATTALTLLKVAALRVLEAEALVRGMAKPRLPTKENE